MPSGASSGSSGAIEALQIRAQIASSSGGVPMKLWMTLDTTGWATSVTRSQRLAAVESVEHVADDRANALLVVGDALGREAALKQRLDLVVLGRVHADEHAAHEFQREDLSEHRDAAEV